MKERYWDYIKVSEEGVDAFANLPDAVFLAFATVVYVPFFLVGLSLRLWRGVLE